jgi:hypothetical protein
MWVKMGEKLIKTRMLPRVSICYPVQFFRNLFKINNVTPVTPYIYDS